MTEQNFWEIIKRSWADSLPTTYTKKDLKKSLTDIRFTQWNLFQIYKNGLKINSPTFLYQ